MQAIKTTYKGPTNTRGSRIYAVAAGGRISIPYPDQLKQGLEAHAAAARALCEKLGWSGVFHAGGLSNGDYVFVFEDSEGPALVIDKPQ